jgi:cytochrome c biogenesis protein CcdA
MVLVEKAPFKIFNMIPTFLIGVSVPGAWWPCIVGSMLATRLGNNSLPLIPLGHKLGVTYLTRRACRDQNN